MKCPNCGADVRNNSEFCEYCGSSITAQMLKEKELLNKAGCPKCGSTNTTFSREKQGEVKGKRGTTVVRSTVGVCKNCGYTWKTDSDVVNMKKRKTWLWILGWICIFPVPLTILLLRNKKMKPAIKYGIVAIAWIAYFMIGSGGNGNNTQNVDASKNTIGNIEVTGVNEQSNIKEGTPENAIPLFIDQFNDNSDEKMVFVSDFTPSDKESGHYRTEFRLPAYTDAIGKSYSFGDATVDIVACKSGFGDVTYRVYMSAKKLEQIISMVEVASPIMDETLTPDELQKTVDYLMEHESANGYYYGELGMVLLGKRNSYELMLKMRND